jgi:hypothetical protein
MTAATQTPPTPPAAQQRAVAVYNVARPGAKQEVDHIVVYGHSNLFYWWPVCIGLFRVVASTANVGVQRIPVGVAKLGERLPS